MSNMRRYRKAAPDRIKVFADQREELNFYMKMYSKGRKSMNEVTPIMKQYGMKNTTQIGHVGAKAFQALHEGCTQFCPHIDFKFFATPDHWIVPAIDTIFCDECLPEFIELINHNDNDKICDYCRGESVMFTEVFTQLGNGKMNINVCNNCRPIFNLTN